MITAITFSLLHLAHCAPSLAPSTAVRVGPNSAIQLVDPIRDTFQDDEAQVTQASPCSPIEPPYLSTEDKIALAPIVFQGKLKKDFFQTKIKLLRFACLTVFGQTKFWTG